MAIVFQYGSNMCSARLNSADRLAGDAKALGAAKTVECFDLAFTVWSKTNTCAAADIVPSTAGRKIFGVIYEIPDFLIFRDSAKENGRRSMDAIEGEGVNYIRQSIELERMDGSIVSALTYVVKDRRSDITTSMHYVQHILDGLKENGLPEEYRQYVISRVIANNGGLAHQLEAAPRDA